MGTFVVAGIAALVMLAMKVGNLGACGLLGLPATCLFFQYRRFETQGVEFKSAGVLVGQREGNYIGY